MTLENAQTIVDALQDEGYEAEVHENYSGRGMYGEKTAGVVAEVAEKVVWFMGNLGIDDHRRVDSLGRDCIVY